jgi:integrase
MRRLVDAAEHGQVRGRLSGPDRAMVYRIALGTGYRSGELQSLTPESFSLDGEYPVVVVEASASKLRRRDVEPIQTALAATLRRWLQDIPRGERLFPVNRWQTLSGLKFDLRSSGIEYETDEGFADIHSQRHTYTSLAKSDAPVKVVQTLARHSTPALTLNCYSHVGLYDEAPALDALPDLTKQPPRSEPAAKTGPMTATWHKVAAP